MPKGTALYVRRIDKRHGSPQDFAKLCKSKGLKWIALGALWQDVSKAGKPTSKMMNSLDVLKRYGAALQRQGIEVYVWGYPWMGREEAFVARMCEAANAAGCAAGCAHILLDPELGANPTRASSGAGKAAANAHADKLVSLFASAPDAPEVLGLSTYGSGWRLKWFPLLAFTRALVRDFGGRCFIGGQTYTVGEDLVDMSIADMVKVIGKAGGVVQRADRFVHSNGCQVVPNFGTYARYTSGPKKGEVRRKTGPELTEHLYGFVNEEEPVDALIGWAENFMSDATWDALHEFSKLMDRGVCEL